MAARDPLTISSVEQIHRLLGQGPPPHPHVAVIGASWQPPMQITAPIEGREIRSELYSVSAKRGDECRLAFGRQAHDAQAGTIVFLAPGQTFRPVEAPGTAALDGDAWTLVFHPDLLRGAELSARVREHGFFRYAPEEALHLEEDEREELTLLVRSLEREAARSPDAFSNEVIVSHLELLFAYCRRFYARQFQARASIQGRVVARLERHLDEYLGSPRPREEGLPTVAGCARSLGYSADYLSDLLREETGDSARDHIHRALIEAAKRRLAASSESVSEIAYGLGFQQPQHFSKLFKQKTGSSPAQWRG
jgi:AraC-like DNA-binding protein